jgi:hypothetical protein
VSPRTSTGPKLGTYASHSGEPHLDLAYVRSAEWQHLALSQPAFRCGEKVRRPGVESGAFLHCPIMPLVNPDYASPATAQMIEYRFSDFEARAEALQPCRQCSAKVMQASTGSTECSVEHAFGHPLKSVSRSPARTSTSFDRDGAP